MIKSQLLKSTRLCPHSVPENFHVSFLPAYFSNHFPSLDWWERSNTHCSGGRTRTFGPILSTRVSEFGAFICAKQSWAMIETFPVKVTERRPLVHPLCLLGREGLFLTYFFFLIRRIISNRTPSGLFCNIIQTARSAGANAASRRNGNGTIPHFLLFLVIIWNSLTLAKTLAIHLSRKVNR